MTKRIPLTDQRTEAEATADVKVRAHHHYYYGGIFLLYSTRGITVCVCPGDWQLRGAEGGSVRA